MQALLTIQTDVLCNTTKDKTKAQRHTNPSFYFTLKNFNLDPRQECAKNILNLQLENDS